MSIIITSLPSGTYNQTITDVTTTESAEIIKYLVIDTSVDATEEEITVEYNGETVVLNLITECRYTPVQVHFINKHGAEQIMHFFKAKTDSIDIKSETFESDRGQPSLGNHQFVTYNISSKSKFKVNTGFIKEAINDTITELLHSEKVWMYKDSLYYPLTVSSKSLEWKTRVKDRLINYEIEFEYAYNNINSI